MRDIALLNAAAALVVAGKSPNLETALPLAAGAIDSGAARQTLARLIAVAAAG
jgi:anthranilate phosphoribosyltransferase